MVIFTSNLINKGGTPLYSGVKKAATMEEAEVPIPFLGMCTSQSYFILIDSNMHSHSV